MREKERAARTNRRWRNKRQLKRAKRIVISSVKKIVNVERKQREREESREGEESGESTFLHISKNRFFVFLYGTTLTNTAGRALAGPLAVTSVTARITTSSVLVPLKSKTLVTGVVSCCIPINSVVRWLGGVCDDSVWRREKRLTFGWNSEWWRSFPTAFDTFNAILLQWDRVPKNSVFRGWAGCS